MNGSSYTPGQWTALSCNGLVALLEPAAGDGPALELWRVADGRGTFLDGLAVLTRSGLVDLPSFVLAARGQDGATNIAVRGAARVEVVTDDGTELIDGTAVSTWTERVFPVVHRLTVQVPDAAATPWLPLIGGLVRAAALTLPEHVEALHVDPLHSEAAHVDPLQLDPLGAAPGAVAGAGEESERPVAQAVVVPVVDAADVDEDPGIDLGEVESVADPTAASTSGGESTVELDAVGLDAPPIDGPLSDQPTQVLTRIVEPALVGAGAAVENHGPVNGVHGAARHDGGDDTSFTILSSTLADLREGLPVWDGRPAPVPEPVRVDHARLVLSTGLVVALDRPVLIGRAPQAMRLGSRDLPRLVAVPSPQQDISRTHAEVRVVGDDVLVTDLDSTNGVYLLAAGLGARRLHPGEPTALGASETVDLGDGVTFTVERGT